jgi:hypothetical protein
MKKKQVSIKDIEPGGEFVVDGDIPITFLSLPNNPSFVLDLASVCDVNKPVKLKKFHPKKVYPPKFGDFLICLFVPLDRQQERLGDFEEKFSLVWVPRFGVRTAKFIYIVHAARTAVTVVRAAAIGALVDRVMRAFGW